MRSCKHKHLQNRFTTNMLASSTHCTGLHIALFVCFNKQQNVHKHLTRLPRFTKSKNVCVVEVCTSCFACQQQGWSVYGCLCVCVCVRERECVWVSVTHSPFVHKIMKSSYRVHLLRIQQLHIFQPLSTLHAGQIKCSERGLKKKVWAKKVSDQWMNKCPLTWYEYFFFLFWRRGGHLEGFIVLPFPLSSVFHY